MMKNVLCGLLLSIVLSLLTGCVSSQKGTILPGNDIRTLKKFYVVQIPADTRGVNRMIADELVTRGFVVTTGPASLAPVEVDAVLTYQDKWMWDITMYMIKLDIQLRKPVSEVPMATGTSTRSSLVRKSPPEMIKEVLDQIYGQAGVQAATSLGPK